MTTNLLVIFRPPLQYFVRPINSILRLPYHAWDHRISHNCKGRRNRSEFVIIFCPDQIAIAIIFGPSGQNIFDEILVLAEKYYDMTALHSTTHNFFLSCRILIFHGVHQCHYFSYCLCSKITRAVAT